MIELVRIFSGMKMRVELHAHCTPNVYVIHAMFYPCFSVLRNTRLHPQGKGGPEGTLVQRCPYVADLRKNTIIQNIPH